jgi:hypothetical protein
MGFDDPAAARGTAEEVIREFRRIREEIREAFLALYRQRLALPAQRI